ncbi:protoplast regeneration and killer toxin resistance protein [Metarhizium album ARSEF 1941]|uniref:Protoplast regeneration and killer toxin resistance protein n=1 Tax=Metarhizium album (strain ARSEF 1941) TaxID=1081103 RepID=A0A0B2WR00_METAS|nr:protoplast regeneration and killer toxin resistance protein [Metarhizium album ARSEF 1941]KHN98491.1 protoplast regeneration and killer toxin resistance protein [Metarhizium album ARSEF 1941]
MAAVGASPPRTMTTSHVEPRDHTSLNGYTSPATVAKPRNTLDASSLGPASARPVSVDFHDESWVQLSNANVDLAKPQTAHFLPVQGSYDHASPAVSSDGSEIIPASESSTARQSQPATVGPVLSDLDALAAKFTDSSLDLSFSPTSRQRYETSTVSPKDRPRDQHVNRNSRESDDTASTSPQQQPSAESSVATSVSSISGVNDNSEIPTNGDSPGSSIMEGNLSKNLSVPQFQYHHQQQEHPAQVPSGGLGQSAQSSSSEVLENGGHVRRHLTPTSTYFQRSSFPRPQSSYSTLSDCSPRGRSPNLLPGGSHMRAPSVQSRKSPDPRPSSYAELLKVPYPQQAPPSFSLDNSDLRTVIGNNASLLSTQKTLEMYRQNVKKTTDPSTQYSFAVFLISTAQEQGVDVSNPKSKKTAQQPLRDLDSPVVEGSVTSPYDLIREARQILQRLANGGYPFAQYYLADGYASGLFSKGKEDYNSAFPLFVLAAKHGHAESAYRTALCYEFGWGCRKDPVKAVQFLRTAASKRHPGAMTRLGKACLSGDLGEKRYREGIKWLKLAAEAADLQYNAAPYQLGCLYETGYGDDIFADASYAAELFTQAADLGHPEANYRMGDAYEHGRLNCPRDPALSVHFYTGAAERGHSAAMMGLCAWYMVGAPPILEKDEEEAYEWARRSAELGFVKAQYAVGYFTEMGIGCRRDILEANVWYVKAADAGDERAKQRIAVIQAAVSGGGMPMDVGSPRGKKGGKDDKDCVVM